MRCSNWRLAVGKMACNGEEVLPTGFESVQRPHYVWCKIGFGSDELTVIIILALVALFIGLRLYSVLGERTGHEQQPILKPADPDAARVERAPMPVSPVPQPTPDANDLAYLPTAGPGVRALLAADARFMIVGALRPTSIRQCGVTSSV